MNPSISPGARQPAADPAGTSLARVKRRMVALSVALVAMLTLPYVWGAARAWLRGEPGIGWLAGVGGGLLALGAALFAIRHSIDPALAALERTGSELEVRYRSAAAATRDTNDYLREVSHEIRATMQAVLGLAQLLSRSPLDATQQRQTRTIDGAARALLRIINDLLAFSGPEPHRFDLVPMGCSLHELLRVSADLLEPSAKDKGLALELQLTPTLPDRVLVDVGRVQQVVLGVCRHAIETCEQGPLRIEACAKSLGDKRFDLSLSVAGPSAPALPESEPKSPGAVSGGAEPEPASQAGLSLSRRLATLMGGSIRLGASRGAIELLLPVPRADGIPEVSARGQRPSLLPPSLLLPPPSLLPASSLPPSSLPMPIRLPATASPILLVEADERAQATAVELLENLGFDVEVAGSAERAFERAPQTKFALILWATELPGIDAYAAAVSLRTLLGSRPAIVGCTGESLVAARARPGAAGLDALLTKPLERAALCATLAQWLPDEGHPASSGTRLSQTGALKQATRRALTAKRMAPVSPLPDLAPGQRRERLLELLVLEAPAQVRNLARAVADDQRDEVAALAERLAERSAGVGALKMAALCGTLIGARALSLEQLGESVKALEKALEALLAALGEPASSPESLPASAASDRNPDSP